MSHIDSETVIERLRSDDVDIRRVTLTELDENLDLVSADDLLPLLHDSDAAVRRLVINALEELGDVRAIPALIDAVTDSNSNVANAARTALREFRTPDALDPLLEGISAPGCRRAGSRDPGAARTAKSPCDSRADKSGKGRISGGPARSNHRARSFAANRNPACIAGGVARSRC